MFGFHRDNVATLPPEKPVEVVETPPVVVSNPAPVVAADTVYVDNRSNDMRFAISQRLQDILGFIFSIGAIIILARFVLLAAGANMDGQFASYVTSLSQPLVGPFLTLFDNPTVPHFTTFEVGDLIALLAYAIVTSLLCYLVSLLLNPTVSNRRVLVRRDQ